MSRLFHPLQAGHRQQIKDRATKQKKEMTKKTIQKGTNKNQVTGGRDLRSSAAYPRDFGREELPEGCHWQHANFDSMLQLVSYAARNGGYHPDPDVPIQIQPSVSAFETLRARLEER
ncbi:unnamed protein product [Cladocopium goreaui]|uniref:Uncharacterized protein n=1 Tax=Cladocopium goreaui TaxID=2562237 RepID=A0A9P1C988_9DINO|nr:unnamed protein product [Cladocopium goreaui]